MTQPLARQIEAAFDRLFDAVLAIVPALLVLASALLLGILFGLLVKLAVLGLFALRDRATKGRPERARPLLRAAGLKAEPRQVAGAVSFWASVVVVLSVGVSSLEPGALKSVLLEIVAFVPKLLGASLLALLGLGAAALVRRSVLLAAVNAGLPWARAGSRAVYVVVATIAFAASLEHLGVGRSILVATFSILAGGIVLALALAFGLGGRDLARRALERKLRAEQDETGIRHV